MNDDMHRIIEKGILVRSFNYAYEEYTPKILLRGKLLDYLDRILKTIGRNLSDITQIENRVLEQDSIFTIEDLMPQLDKYYYYVTAPSEYLWMKKEDRIKHLLDVETGDFPKDPELYPIISPDLIFRMKDGFIDFETTHRRVVDGGYLIFSLRINLIK